jgi:hypothetical protein
MQAPMAETRMFSRQFAQPLLYISIFSPAPIPATRSWCDHEFADVTLAGHSSSKRRISILRSTSPGSFSDYQLQHVLIQTQIGHQLLQPCVLITQTSQPLVT